MNAPVIVESPTSGFTRIAPGAFASKRRLGPSSCSDARRVLHGMEPPLFQRQRALGIGAKDQILEVAVLAAPPVGSSAGNDDYIALGQFPAHPALNARALKGRAVRPHRFRIGESSTGD